MARIVPLNGQWTLAGYYPGAYDAGAPPCAALMPARVPGTVQGDLLRAHALPDPRVGLQSRAMEWTALREWVYETRFTVPEEPQEGRSERFYIQFGGVTGAMDISVNGERAGGCDSAWQRPVFDVTAHILQKEENTLAVRFRAAPQLGGHYTPMDALQRVEPRVPGGWRGCPPMPVTGLTEGVTLKCVSFLRIEHAALRTVPYGTEGGRINVTLSLDAFAAGRYNFKYRVLLGDELVANEDIPDHVAATRVTLRHRLTLPRVGVWEPGAGGPLYKFMLTITRGGVRCDMVEDVVGFRTIEYKDALEVNGKPLFVRGARWMPPYPFPGDARAVTRGTLAALKAAGFNLIRVFGGGAPPSDALLEACDALGLLVWCDCPLAPGEGELGAHPAYIAALCDASEALARRVANHPCLALMGGGGLCEGDGGALDARHPALGALARLMRRDDVALPFLPDDGPFEYISAQGVASSRRVSAQAAGAPAWPPDALTPLLMHQDVPPPAYMGTLSTVPDARWHAVFELGRALQAARVRRAILHARKWNGPGFIVDSANETFPALASPALIEHDGALRPAFWAAMDALRDDALCVECPEGARPGVSLPVKVLLLSRRAGGRLLNARVRVMTITGELLAAQAVSLSIGAEASVLYDAALDAPQAGGLLVVRVDGELDGAPLRPATEFICVGGADAPLEPFMRLPPLRLNWLPENGAWRLCNTSLYTAAHIVIHPAEDGTQPMPAVVTLPPRDSALIAGVRQPGAHVITALNEQVAVTVSGAQV